MCTIVFAWQLLEDAPLVLAANRDELMTRPSDPPLRLVDDPPLWGGRDRLAGGTWLAVDPRGRVAAVTNRHPGGRLPPRDAGRRSRGGLPIGTLIAGSDDGSRAFLEALAAADYNPVNVVYLTPATALWVGLDDEKGRRTTELSPGVHVLTEQDPDDPSSSKATRLLHDARAAAAGAPDAGSLAARFRDLLRSHDRHGGGPESAACIHEERFGTVSSATVVVSGRGVQFDHAEGPPCVTPYRPVLGDGIEVGA